MRSSGGQEGEESERSRPTYRGETSRTPYTRAQSHYSNYLKGKDSFMFEHTMEAHGGDVRGCQEDYEMVIVAKDKDVMRRLLREAVRITRGLDKKMEVMKIKLRVDGGEEKEVEILLPTLLLNSHAEWYMPRLVQVTIK